MWGALIWHWYATMIHDASVFPATFEASGGRLPGAWRLASHGGGEVTNQQQRLSLLASWIILDHLGSSWIILDHLGSSWIILDHLGNSESWKLSYYPRSRRLTFGNVWKTTLSWSKDRGVVSCCVNVLEPSPQVVPAWSPASRTVHQCAILPLFMQGFLSPYPILPDLAQLTPKDPVGPWSFQRRKVLVPRTATVKVPRDLPFVEFKLVTAGGHRRNFRTMGQGGWEVCECCWALKILPRSLQRERPHGSRSISTAAFTADSKRTGHVTSHLFVFLHPAQSCKKWLGKVMLTFHGSKKKYSNIM